MASSARCCKVCSDLPPCKIFFHFSNATIHCRLFSASSASVRNRSISWRGRSFG
ncbi:MAG: hypothetical protein KDF59_10945 [Nitrosomonas sp.]|nr:hypothetical protein [Nitrosomonas sp.]